MEHKTRQPLAAVMASTLNQLLLASNLPAFMRNLTAAVIDLFMARREIATCAISGAVGTFAHIDPSVEAHVAKKWG